MSRDYARAMTPSPTAPVALRRLPSPLGRIEVVADDTAIVSLAIEHDGELPHDAFDETPNAVTEVAVRQLEEYFAGQRREFDVPVALEHGTPFQRAVWQQLQDLPWGAVASYGELGEATGRPSAGRAVGGAVGANPLPIIVPCHRVLGSTGVITGYSAGEGIPTKSWLLDHEGIAYRLPTGLRPDAPTLLEIPDAEPAA